MDDLELAVVATRFGEMSEIQLMREARGYDGLTEAVQGLLRAEFARRGLEPPLVDEEIEQRVMVTLRVYRDLPEAVIVRGLLESAGIGCFLADEMMVRADWLASNAIGGVKLQVSVEDEAAALAILEEPIPPQFEAGEMGEFEQPACPQCGSLDVGHDDQDRKVVAMGLGVVTSPLPFLLLLPGFLAQRNLYVAHVWKCEACGCVWLYEGEE